MSAPLLRLDFRLDDSELDLPEEMLAPPPSIRGLLLNRTALTMYTLVALGAGGLFGSTWSLERREAAIRESIDGLAETARQYKDDIARAEALRDRRNEIRAYIDTVEAVDEHRYGVVHALDQFDRSRPRDTWLERIETVREDTTAKVTILRLTAVAPTQELMAEYQRALESSPWLRNVQFQNSELVSVSGQQAIRFGLTTETRHAEREFLVTEAITSEGLVSGARNAPSPAAGPVLAPVTSLVADSAAISVSPPGTP